MFLTISDLARVRKIFLKGQDIFSVFCPQGLEQGFKIIFCPIELDLLNKKVYTTYRLFINKKGEMEYEKAENSGV